MMSGCLCTAAVEDSYSLWELIKAAAALMSKLWFLVKYFPSQLPCPSQAMVAVKPWGSISQFLSVVVPGSVLWWKGHSRNCSSLSCVGQRPLRSSWGSPHPFPGRIQYFTFSERICVFQEQWWILSQQFLLNQNFAAFILVRYVCVYIGFENMLCFCICFVYLLNLLMFLNSVLSDTQKPNQTKNHFLSPSPPPK